MVAVWEKINSSAQFFQLQQAEKWFLIQFLTKIVSIRLCKFNFLLFSRRYMWIGSFGQAVECPACRKRLFSEKRIQSLNRLWFQKYFIHENNKISFYPRVFNTLRMRILQETKNRFFHRQVLQPPLKHFLNTFARIFLQA